MTHATLTARQRAFVRHYAIEGNATSAARKAGFAHPGQQGCRLLKNVQISREIRLIEEESRKRSIATREEVLEHLTAVMRSNMADFLTPDLHLNPEGLRDPKKVIGLRRLSHNPEKSRRFSLAMADKIRAIDLMCRMQGWYPRPGQPPADQPLVLHLHPVSDFDGTPFCANCFAKRNGMRLVRVEIV